MSEQSIPDLPPIPSGYFRFIALDVETACREPASICQIGLAFVRQDNAVDTWSAYIKPPFAFDPVYTRMHGIDDRAVAAAPPFETVMQYLSAALESHTVFGHSVFDRTAINAASEIDGIAPPRIKWADSVVVARRAWPELQGNGGHGLASMRDHLGLTFRHHDAAEDARAAAEIVLRAEAETGEGFERMVAPRKNKDSYRKFRGFESNPALSGDSAGPFFGQIAVFTGKLSMSRENAAELAAKHGFSVAAGVTRKTTMLIVGDQDIALLAGHTKSSKHRKAEALAAEGQQIRILGETEFLALLPDKD